MKKFFCFFLFCLVFVSFSQNAFGGKMEVFNLKNNIKVIFEKTKGVEVASIKVFSPVSVVYEDKTNFGISSLAMQLMTKATKNRSKDVLSGDVKNIGSNIGVGVDYDYVNFDMSFLSKYFVQAVEILADVVKNPCFNDEDITMEKELALASIKSRKDSIHLTTVDIFTKELYKNMCYANPIIGTSQTVSKITKEQLENWHKNAFNASTIIISISGNLSKSEVKNVISKYFQDMKPADKIENKIENVSLNEDKIKRVKGKFNQAYVFKGYLAPSLKDKDFVTLKVIGSLLGGRMTSTMFMELREKLGLAYEVSTIYPSRTNQSYFVIYLGLDKKNIDLTLKRIDEILSDFCSGSVSNQELKDTKSYIKGLYMMDRQTVGKKSFYNGYREVVGQGCKYDEEYLKRIEEVNQKDILEVANKIFKQKALTVIVSSDEK